MKIIICKPLESGETNVKMQCTKEERRALEDLEGTEINVPTIKEPAAENADPVRDMFIRQCLEAFARSRIDTYNMIKEAQEKLPMEGQT